MYDNPRRLRRPEERVGQLANADLPPPAESSIDQDAALVAGLRARNDAAFEQLIDRHYAAMLRLAVGFVRSREEAEEVIQETWLAVLAGVHRFEGKASFRTWLFRILVNRAQARGKREARTLPFSALTPTLPGRRRDAVRNRDTTLVGSVARSRASPAGQRVTRGHRRRGRTTAGRAGARDHLARRGRLECGPKCVMPWI